MGVTRTNELQVGSSDDTNTEVLAGLQQGDQVVVGMSTPGQAAQKTRAANSGAVNGRGGHRLGEHAIVLAWPSRRRCGDIVRADNEKNSRLGHPT